MTRYMDSMGFGYRNLLHFVRDYGYTYETGRNGGFVEMVGLQVVLRYPEMSWGAEIGRNLNFDLGAVEALQLISGEAYPNLMLQITKNLTNYQDGQVFHGAYGPRIRPQLRYAVRELMNPNSRRSLITIWDHAYDQQSRKDLPCTISLQFILRDDYLDMVVYMRSNDLWLGFPYDVFQFTQLQMTVANAIEAKYGNYVHMVGSAHIYTGDLEKIDGLKVNDPDGYEYRGIEQSGLPWCVLEARSALDDKSEGRHSTYGSKLTEEFVNGRR